MDVVWARANRGVWGLALAFGQKLYLTRDLVDDRCVHASLAVLQPAPKPAPNHVQKFRMPYTFGKGFTAENFSHLYVFLQAAVPQLWALLTDCEPYMPFSGSNIAWASADMNVSTSMMYPFLSLLVSSEGVRRHHLCPKNVRSCFRNFLELYLCLDKGGGQV